MLSTHSTSTPRPLPPAKARKSTSVNFSRIPPPPYAPPLDEVLLDSPIPVTAQLINAASKGTGAGIEGIGLPGTPGIDDWMNEKSRGELSDLLLKADGIIKSRETELSMTSALCKTLYTDNVTLKTKHEALIARLPGTRGSTPTNSRPSSPLPIEGPSIQHSPSPSVTFPSSPDETPPQQSIMSRIKRARRISVTPGELALLADQNAELIEKFEKLETDSLKADQAGKRKLRKLEQEIQSLRDELETTQARGVELEEQAKAAEAAVTVQKRKEECEARRQAAKADSSDGIRDFAPSNAPRTSPIKRSVSGSSSLVASSSMASSEYSVERALANMTFEDDDSPTDPQSYFPTPPGSTRDLPPPEYAIVSQLLFKIRELEETNSQIKEQQRSTEEQMRAAQWDAESIRRVYDCLDDQDVDLEIQDDDEVGSNYSGTMQVPSNGIIRFSSLRRTIVGDMSRLMASESSDIFANGISAEMQSTVRDDLVKGVPAARARKTVVGLFDPEPDTSFGSLGRTPYPHPVSSSFQQADSGDLSIWSSSATDGLTPAPPMLGGVPFPMEDRRTLGSELGSEFGDGWHGVNHHLRTSSLLDLANMYSSPVSPSGSTTGLPTPNPSNADDDQTTPTRTSWDGADPSTPPAHPGLQLTIQPPTPTPEKLRSPASLRQFRLSQTVRARTNRWVEGRYPPSPSLGEKVVRKRASASTLGRRSASSLLGTAPGGTGLLGEAFENAVVQIKRVASRGSLAQLRFPSASASSSSYTARAAEERELEDTDGNGLDGTRHEVDRSVSIRRDASVVDPLGAKREGIVGLVIHAWLWLQFVVVVVLFLWAMAKRGPKVVLEAERRSAHRAASRQT